METVTRQAEPSTEPYPPLWFVLIAFVYFTVALGSLWIATFPYKVATVWFADAVGAVALLALPVRRWPVLLGLLAISNVLLSLIAHGYGVDMLFDPGIFAAGSCANMLLAAALLRRLHIDPDMLHQPGRLGRALAWGALVPGLLSSLSAAALLSLRHHHDFMPTWITWFSACVIGSMTALPVALLFWLQDRGALRQSLNGLKPKILLLLTLVVTLLAAWLMPQPFVVVALPLVLLAAQAGFALTSLATLLIAMVLALLQSTGVLYFPDSPHWWSTAQFYGSFLACLLPGLFLAASVEDRSRVTRALRVSEQRFRQLYTGTPAMMHSIDPEGRIVEVSHLWLQTLGYSEPEVVGRLSTDFMTADSARHAHHVAIPQAIREGSCHDVAYQMVARDGRIVDVLLSAIWTYDDAGRPLHSQAVMQDVTEKNRLAERSHYAEHDPLTGLPNRMLLQDRLKDSCVQHARQHTRFAVGFLDLDHFKEINDTHGHEAGDLLLQEVARRLQTALRSTDTICRLAGDEFVILFADINNAHTLRRLAQKVLNHIARPLRLGKQTGAPTIQMSASLGLALFPDHGGDPDTLLSLADQAMYEAKAQGRNRVAIYQAAAAAN